MEPTDNQEIERLELESRIPSQTRQEALTWAATCIPVLPEWENEARQAGQIDQSDDAYFAVMQEHLADMIEAAMSERLDKWRESIRVAASSIRWGGSTVALRELEKLLGES